MNEVPSEHIRPIWPKKINEFNFFISGLFSTHEEIENIATYGFVSVDNEKNRERMIARFALLLFSKYSNGGTSICIKELPEFSDYALTEKDLEIPYIKSIKDELFIKIEMKAHFKKREVV